jgi:formate dehydrogenase iron-sulfur subunit
MDYEAFAARRDDRPRRHRRLRRHDGHAADMARFAMEFCAKESCGKCTPAGSGRCAASRSSTGSGRGRCRPDANLVLLEDLCTTMENGSLCAMGGLTPMPVRSALRHFPADFAKNPPVDPTTRTHQSHSECTFRRRGAPP